MVQSYKSVAWKAALFVTVSSAGILGVAREGEAMRAPAPPPPAVFTAAPFDRLLAEFVSDHALGDLSVADKRVTVSFQDAPIARVLAWLSKNDANFVATNQGIPKDLKLSLNVKDRPISEVENAIATAMGGSWVHNGGILVFQPGLDALGSTPTRISSATPALGAPDVKLKLQLDQAAGTAQAARMQSSTQMARLQPEIAQALAEAAKEMNSANTSMTADQRKQVEAAMAQVSSMDLGKTIQDALAQANAGKAMPDSAYQSDQAARIQPQIAQAMAEAFKQLSAAKASMTADQRKQVEAAMAQLSSMDLGKTIQDALAQANVSKALQDAATQVATAKATTADRAPSMTGSAADQEKMALAQRAKVMTELKTQLLQAQAEIANAMKTSETQPVRITKNSSESSADSLIELMKSLTPNQKEKMAHNGYLKVADLNPKQVKLLGGLTGHFSVAIKTNEGSLTIKSE